MTHDEAMKLAHKLKNKLPFRSDVVDLCDYILSGDYKRDIESAAFERCNQIAITRAGIASYDVSEDYQDGESAAARDIADEIRALIQPPVQKENGE